MKKIALAICVVIPAIILFTACSNISDKSWEMRKDDAVSAINKRLDSMENEFNKLEAKAEMKGDELQEQTQAKIDDLKLKLQDARSKSSDFSESTEDTYQKAQDDVENMLDNIEYEFQKVRNELD